MIEDVSKLRKNWAVNFDDLEGTSTERHNVEFIYMAGTFSCANGGEKGGGTKE